MKFNLSKKKFKQVLKYYDKEVAKYNYVYNAGITPKEGLQIINLIKRKFKVNQSNIDFDFKDKRFGGYAYDDKSISFRKSSLNIMIVCHEMSHLIAYKNKIYGHNYKFAKIMAKVVDYVTDHIEFKMRIT